MNEFRHKRYIRELLSNGESETLEFKVHLPRAGTINRTLIAFANTSGGVLIVGVDDTGYVIGLADNEISETILEVRAIAASLFSMPVVVHDAMYEDKNLVLAHIPKVSEELWPVLSADGKYYVREGTLNMIGSSQDIKDRIIKHRKLEQNATALNSRKIEGIPNTIIRCFVAMSFRDEEEPALADYYAAMLRAAERSEVPIELVRIDYMEGDYEISQQLMDEIEKADVVLADFTLDSSNVYFELGYARGLKKHVIQTARKETTLEFDVRNWRTIVYRNATELEEYLVNSFDALGVR